MSCARPPPHPTAGAPPPPRAGPGPPAPPPPPSPTHTPPRFAVAELGLRAARVLARKASCLQGMSQSVTVVQDHSATSFAFVAGDDLGLAHHTPGHLLGDAQAVEILPEVG